MAPATYTATTPQPGENPSTSQPLFLNNFISLNQQFGKDHIELIAGSPKFGCHTQVTFAATQSAPGYGNGVSDLYSNLVAGVAELFFQNSRSSTLQLTDLVIQNASNAGTAGGIIYWIDTPWNLRFLFCTTNRIPGNTAQTLLYPTAFSQVLVAQATANDNNPHYCSADQTNSTTLTLKTDALVFVSVFVVGRL